MAAPDTVAVNKYHDTIDLLLQQMQSELKKCVLVDSNLIGEAGFYDQQYSVSMNRQQSRFQKTVGQAGSYQRRMLKTAYYDCAIFLDPKDMSRQIADPKSPAMQSLAAASQRQEDDTIIAAAGGTAYTDKTGATGVTLSGTQLIASTYDPDNSGNAKALGMTKGKGLKAKKNLDQAFVPQTDRFMWVTSAQMFDMLLSVEVTSKDYNIVAALVEGTFKTWLGFAWITCERLVTNAASARLCYAMHRYGMQFANGESPTRRLDERPDLSYTWQAYAKQSEGATRMEEDRFVQIACAE